MEDFDTIKPIALPDVLEEATGPAPDATPEIRDLIGSIPYLVTVRIPDTDAATAAKYGPFFIAPFPCVVVAAYERHQTAGSDVSAVTLDIEKLTDGTAKGSGVSVLAGTFNLKATANTYQSKAQSATPVNASLNIGDALSLLTSGTLTAANGVEVTVLIKILSKYLIN